MGVTAVIFKEQMSRYIFNMSSSVFWRIVMLAAGAGLATWLIGLALDNYILTPIFCNNAGANVSICTDSTVISSNIATLLVGIITVPLLAIIAVKRALVVVVAAIVSLWGVSAWIAGPWYLSLLWVVGAYMAVYAVLAWINRLRGDLAALLFMTIFVVLARLVLAL